MPKYKISYIFIYTYIYIYIIIITITIVMTIIMTIVLLILLLLVLLLLLLGVVTAQLSGRFEALVLDGKVRVWDVHGCEGMLPSNQRLGEDGIHDAPIIIQYFVLGDRSNFPSVGAGRHQFIQKIKRLFFIHHSTLGSLSSTVKILSLQVVQE